MAVKADVLTLVQRALKKDPTLSSRELQERAARVDKSVADLTTRQFHARYALQAKKQLAGPRKKSAKSKRGAKRRKRRPGSKQRRPASRQRRPGARRRRSSTRQRTDPVRDLVRERYEESKAALDDAMDAAFERSLRADSLTGVNDLLTSLEGLARDLKGGK